MKGKDIAGAKARGFMTGEDVKILRSRIGANKRVCVACGRQFKAPNQIGTRMFGCGCCALTHMRSNPSRKISKGDRVTLIWLGDAATVIGFTKQEEEVLAVVETEQGGKRYGVKSEEIERIHALEIEHATTCQHGKRWTWTKEDKPKKEEENDEEVQ